jgi:hypothetical protein
MRTGFVQKYLLTLFPAFTLHCPAYFFSLLFFGSDTENITRARRRLSTINDKPLSDLDGMGDLSLKENEEKAAEVSSATAIIHYPHF